MGGKDKGVTVTEMHVRNLLRSSSPTHCSGKLKLKVRPGCSGPFLVRCWVSARMKIQQTFRASDSEPLIVRHVFLTSIWNFTCCNLCSCPVVFFYACLRKGWFCILYRLWLGSWRQPLRLPCDETNPDLPISPCLPCAADSLFLWMDKTRHNALDAAA